MIRLGLCCTFLRAPIKFRTTTASYLSRLQKRGGSLRVFLAALIRHNTSALKEAITYCHDHHIGSFRITSRFFPLYTHEEFGYRLEDLPEADAIISDLKKCRQLAAGLNIRLTMHPDPFVVLNSPHKAIQRKSIQELLYHAKVAKAVGADVINIHGGGAYGEKGEALKRLKHAIRSLPKTLLKCLTLENDDRVFTPADLLPLCKELSIPFVYDVHHHRCLPDGLTIKEATDMALSTWTREPLFHLSSPLQGWKGPLKRRHHDFINAADFPNEWKAIDPLTIEIEAKAKEVAVEKLYKELGGP